MIELSETDKHLDADYRAQLRSLITFMMEDPRSISATIYIMFMNKSIERIGDHAENIASMWCISPAASMCATRRWSRLRPICRNNFSAFFSSLRAAFLWAQTIHTHSKK